MYCRFAHKVVLTKGFYLGMHQVTQAQWQAVMGSNPSRFKGADRPVETVTWKDCQTFCRKLGKKTGKRFRLPTEAEWEYACRAGTLTPFHFGETIRTTQANYHGHYTYGKGRKGCFRKKTRPVGSFPPNPWGLYDMHGNVKEWCQDWYGPYPSADLTERDACVEVKDGVISYGACPPGGLRDPQGPEEGKARVLRGGSWGGHPRACRAAHRNRLAPTRRGDRSGCRVVLCLD